MIIERMIKMNQPRTVEDFVEDMVSNGRSLSQILTVARCCHGENFKKKEKDDIESEFIKLRRRMKKRNSN